MRRDRGDMRALGEEAVVGLPRCVTRRVRRARDSERRSRGSASHGLSRRRSPRRRVDAELYAEDVERCAAEARRAAARPPGRAVVRAATGREDAAAHARRPQTKTGSRPRRASQRGRRQRRGAYRGRSGGRRRAVGREMKRLRGTSAEGRRARQWPAVTSLARSATSESERADVATPPDRAWDRRPYR